MFELRRFAAGNDVIGDVSTDIPNHCGMTWKDMSRPGTYTHVVAQARAPDAYTATRQLLRLVVYKRSTPNSAHLAGQVVRVRLKYLCRPVTTTRDVTHGPPPWRFSFHPARTYWRMKGRRYKDSVIVHTSRAEHRKP